MNGLDAAVKSNSLLRTMLECQLAFLGSRASTMHVRADKELWKVGDSATHVYLVKSGTFRLASKGGDTKDFVMGALICELDAVLYGINRSTGLRSLTAGTVFSIERSDLADFFYHYPGMLLALAEKVYVV